MADGASVTVVDAFLAALLNGTAFTNYGGLYVQLHTGAPGSAGTANIAGESTRMAAGAFSTPSAGSSSNLAAVTWTSVSTSETYTNISLWSAATGGTFIGSGTITANAVVAGDTFTIPIGDIAVSMPTAA